MDGEGGFADAWRGEEHDVFVGQRGLAELSRAIKFVDGPRHADAGGWILGAVDGAVDDGFLVEDLLGRFCGVAPEFVDGGADEALQVDVGPVF